MPLPPIPGSNYIGRKAAEKLIANAPTLAEVYMLQQEQLPIALQTREVLDLVQVALNETNQALEHTRYITGNTRSFVGTYLPSAFGRGVNFTISTSLIVKLVNRGTKTVKYAVTEGVSSPRTLLSAASTVFTALSAFINISEIKAPKKLKILYGLAIGCSAAAEETAGKLDNEGVWEFVKALLL